MGLVRQLDSAGFDLIGDVHGCGDTLVKLLETLGYRKIRGVYRHISRKVVFIGDIIDRGPRIREALHIARDMVDSDQAVMVLGNHEYNAVAFATETEPGSGRYLRVHNTRNISLLQQTLEQFAAYPKDWSDFIRWFKSLPLFLDWTNFRVVHACWDQEMIQTFRNEYQTDSLTDNLLHLSADKDNFVHHVVDRLLRGITSLLPDGEVMTDSHGITRRVFRTKFWEPSPRVYNDIVFQPDCLPPHIGLRSLTQNQVADLLHYGLNERPLFIGHYWRRGRPEPITSNIACLDYSAVRSGHLVSYRMDQEHVLSSSKFVRVPVVDKARNHKKIDQNIGLSLALNLVNPN